MRCITLQPFVPDRSMPWFDEWSEHNKTCKIYNDGGAYVAIPQGEPSFPKKRHASIRYLIDDQFDELYRQAITDNIPRSDLFSYIFERLQELYPNDWTLRDYVEQKITAASKNLAARKKRFRRKAYLNEWNYFVTITYVDGKFESEEDFRAKLRKCLSNLHTRRGWRYMGVFERAPKTGRLHLHALMYIPEGEMVGIIYERRDYSTRLHRMQVSHPNTFFEKTFGRSDFSAVSLSAMKYGNVMNYILKYLEKTNERIIYSRGIPTEFVRIVGDDEIAAEFFDFCVKYVLYDDIIDYEAEVMHTKLMPMQQIFIEDAPFTS